MKANRLTQSTRKPSSAGSLLHDALIRPDPIRVGIGLALAAIFVPIANAQPNVTWQSPVLISGAADVKTQGAYFGSWAPQNGGANNYPVNGVTFQGVSDLPGLAPGPTLDNGYDGFGSPNTPDSNYNALLQYARFSNEGSTPAWFSWSGMIPGNTYLIQLWANDGRNIGQSRFETVTGGTNTSAPVSFGSDGSGPGQYIIGTFVSDSSGSQTLTLTAFSSGPNPDPQINLFQVRDVTPTPNLTWQAPVTISGTSDVSTLGTYFGSWAPQNGGANNYPVNGVTFQGFSDLPGFRAGPTVDNGYNGFGSPNTSDNNYNTLLQYARFSNEGFSPASFSWSGMTPGNTYLIQLWVNDGRNTGQSRSETVTGGTNTSAPLSFGSDGSGPGQFIIGTFVAGSSGAQTLILTPFSTGPNPDPQINLVQVRDITATLNSAPTITSIAVSGPTLAITATNGPANGPFTFLATADITLPLAQWSPVLTNSFDGSGAINLVTNAVDPAKPHQFYILRTQR
jgi:Tfp pilus assembly protein PilX